MLIVDLATFGSKVFRGIIRGCIDHTSVHQARGNTVVVISRRDPRVKRAPMPSARKEWRSLARVRAYRRADVRSLRQKGKRQSRPGPNMGE